MVLVFIAVCAAGVIVTLFVVGFIKFLKEPTVKTFEDPDGEDSPVKKNEL